jgi:cell wall-associated NlpC family hydrolase
MISRAQEWVDKHVPYSQTGTYDGYRTDCSGFVSMAWQLGKPGLTTQTMHTVATNIAKGSLQAGDALNCDTEHIVLFGGWTDGGQTHYVAYE